MNPSPTLKRASIIIGAVFLVVSVAMTAVGLYPQTPQPVADALLAIRFWLSVLGALLIAWPIVIKPPQPRPQLLLIPVLALGIWICSLLAEAAIVYAMVNLFY